MSHQKGKWLLAVTLLLLIGCSRSEDWNILIVTIDTTRADSLGCYGNDTIETPYADALAQEGVLFEKAFSPIPITLPSHTTIMTGKVPFAHGVRDNGIFSVGDQQKTLAEYLKEDGYATGAAIASFPLTSQFGIQQGFDYFEDSITAHFEDFFGKRNIPRQRLFFDERKAGQVNEALLSWLDKNYETPFFAWAHYYDPHQPLEPPAPYNQLYASDLYDGEIAYADASFGVLIERLKKLEIYEKTIIILTSDHGEGNGDHNEQTHSLLVYNSTLQVPLIIKAPGMAAGRRVSQRVGLVDIMPTVMDLLGKKVPSNIQGRSLKTFFDPDNDQPNLPDTPYYGETLSPRLAYSWGELRTLFDGDYKYIYGPRKELYKINPDHRELENLVELDTEQALRMKVKLEQYLDAHAVSGIDASVDLDEETMERLIALGYVHSSGDKVGAIEEVLRDDGVAPQDRVVDNSLFSSAKNFIYQNKPIEAAEALRNLLIRNPENPHYLELNATALEQMGQYGEAITNLEAAVELNLGIPPMDQALIRLGRLYSLNGNVAKGLEYMLKSQEIKKTPEGQYSLARYFRSQGNMDEAANYLRETLQLQPNLTSANLDYALILAQEGKDNEARKAFQKALSLDPYFSRAHYNYGTFQVHHQEFSQAEASFKRAVEIDPQYAPAYYALLALAVEQKDSEKAWEYFFQLTETDRSGNLVDKAKTLMAESL